MHSTINSGILRPDADETLLDIPRDLRQYLTTTEKPQEIYRLVDREHDRRIRLLLRRFTNQIQYGCTNPWCNVPTCLSYRKRVSSGPLRPHTDLTARALAVKCLEQYATHGRDLGRYTNRDKGRKKQSTPEFDGLCWSEPVVPWYTDPTEYLTRKNAIARKRSNEGRGPSDPTSRKVLSHTTNGTATTSRLSNGQTEPPDHPGSNATVESRPVSMEQPIHAQSEGMSQSIPALHPNSVSKPWTEDPKYANARLIEPGDVKKNTTERRHDQASLAQSLFKHLRLQQLNEPPGTSPTGSESAIDQEEKSSTTDFTPSSDTKKSSPIMGLLHPSQPVATFRILPPSAIEWFKKTFVGYRETDHVPPERLKSFLNQSLFFVLSDPTRLLQSASTWSDFEHHKTNGDSSASIDDSPLILPSFRTVIQVYVAIAQCFEGSGECFPIATCLSQALRRCYQLPRCIKQSSNSISATQRRHPFLSNSEIAHLVLFILSMIPSIESVEVIFSSTQHGRVHDPLKHGHGDAGDHHVFPWFATVESVVKFIEHGSTIMYDNFSGTQYHSGSCHLRESIADLVSHRIAIDSATEALRSKVVDSHRSRGIVAEIASLLQNHSNESEQSPLDSHRARQMLIAMQMVIFAKWDRTPVIRRTGPIGGALELLKGLFIQRRDLALDESAFYMDSIPAALDEVEMPYEWLSFKPDATKMHILQFSFLFPPKVVVKYFRSLNLKVMKQSHEKAMAVYANGKTQLLHGPWTVSNIDEVLDLTRAHMARYFVMTIRRSHILEDAIGQIWQRERQELLRPLKVTLGKDEGENGLDHGGVQQEFFRLVFAEAFDPQYGMFDVDPTTHMAWFKPGSLEPLYKYEALGILMSLAIYNGVTLPITMPLAFYRKILGLKVKTIDHIEDGWPEIAKSFKQLLAWDNGDVEDAMALNYEFSYDVFGKTVTIDMSRTQPSQPKTMKTKPSLKGKEKVLSPHTDLTGTSTHLNDDTNPPLPPPTSVTNANRHSFITSYITHLTTITITPQFTSFLRGLHTLLPSPSLSLFPPTHLKLLFEGHPATQPLLIPPWRAIAKFEDFIPSDPLVTWFWDILENDLTQKQLRQLLEFVTASARLPVGGWEGVTFIVQRNGSGDGRLPGSSTCYGRLLLPEYSSREVLRERLVKAVEEGLGFGMI